MTGKNDVLEQKAREWRINNLGSCNDLYDSNGNIDMPMLDETLADFAREIVEECTKVMCSYCRKAEQYMPARNFNNREEKGWRHIVFGGVGTLQCHATAIWEAFGRKERL